MKPNSFIALLAVTAISVAGAGYAVVKRSQAEAAPAAASAPVFPKLLAQVDELATLTVVTAKGKATIRHKSGHWVLAEKDDYPVAVDKLRKLVGGLAGLHFLEPKTDQPDRYTRLEVEDVDKKDAKSRLVTLTGADGKELASLIVGKENYNMGIGGPGGVYVRLPGDKQSWLAEGSVEVPGKALDWLDRSLVDIADGNVARVAFRPAEGDGVTITKADHTVKDFALEAPPAGATLDTDAVNRLGGAFAGITFDDVRKDALPADAAPKATAEATTFDGLRVKAALFDVGGATWVRFTASGSAGKAEEAAKALNQRADGWLYKLPVYKVGALQPKPESLVKKSDGTS